MHAGDRAVLQDERHVEDDVLLGLPPTGPRTADVTNSINVDCGKERGRQHRL